MSAAAPETCGQAMEVPDLLVPPVSVFAEADLMLDPGAKISTQGPKLLKYDLASLLVVEPTVIAVGTKAGE